MKTSNPCINAALQVLDACGIRDGVTVAAGGKHPQLHFHIGNTLHVFAVCATPSDWRSPKNTKRDLKKYLRAFGVVVEIPKPPSQPPRKNIVSALRQKVADLERTVRELQQA